jgi:hypothetical protein
MRRFSNQGRWQVRTGIRAKMELLVTVMRILESSASIHLPSASLALEKE